MAVERYGSKTDVVVKLVLVFFIALLSFSVGTFVGKSFSDSQHKQAQLEPGAADHVARESETTEGHGEADRSVASVEGEHQTGGEKKLTDDEIAKLAEEFVTDDAKPAAAAPIHMPNDAHHSHLQVPAQAPAAAPTAEQAPAQAQPSAAVMAEPMKPAERMAEGKAPVIDNSPPVQNRIPAALPKEVASSAIGKFTVQVSSFATEKEAQALSASLKEQGFSAFYVSAKVKNETRYRVSIGLFATAKEADAYMKDLIKRKKVESALVQKITSAE